MAASGVLRPQLIHGLDILIILSTMYLDFSNQRRAMLILAEKVCKVFKKILKHVKIQKNDDQLFSE